MSNFCLLFFDMSSSSSKALLDSGVVEQHLKFRRMHEWLCALYTFQLIPEIPVIADFEPGWFLWNVKTNKYFPSKVRNAVHTALCCMKRVCPIMPRDLRIILLEMAFCDVWKYPVFKKFAAKQKRASATGLRGYWWKPLDTYRDFN